MDMALRCRAVFMVAMLWMMCAAAVGTETVVEIGVESDGAVRVGGIDVIVNGSSRLLAAIMQLQAQVNGLSMEVGALSRRMDSALQATSVTQWGCWGVCEGVCGQPGVRRRVSSVPEGLVDGTACESPCFPEWRNLTAAGRAGFMEALRKWVAPSGCHREGEENEHVWEHRAIVSGRDARAQWHDLRTAMGRGPILED